MVTNKKLSLVALLSIVGLWLAPVVTGMAVRRGAEAGDLGAEELQHEEPNGLFPLSTKVTRRADLDSDDLEHKEPAGLFPEAVRIESG
ncbi:hypothetical protein V5O48_016653 [Marasmius crinis-equi]|uniref:Uncharacterized protein n=1 Tax=Marasmius crinis-equi TaxID=585013 RepID=A0ABR3ERA2_9AGAR